MQAVCAVSWAHHVGNPKSTYHSEETTARNPTQQPDHGGDPSQTTSERIQNQRNRQRTVAVRFVDADAGQIGEGVAERGGGAVLREGAAGS